MAKSQETFNKKEREKKKQKKRQDKKEKQVERKANSTKGKSVEQEYSYVDEYGNYSSTPPDPSKKQKIKLEDIHVSVPKQDPSLKPDVNRTGRITFFNEDKGFGFIRDDQSQDSVFVHVSGMIDQVRENAKVTFRVERGHKGPTAVDVKAVV
jgi:cold shock CspA family protein